MRFAGNGQELSSLQIGSDQADYANAVSIDGNQVSYVVGATSGLLPTGSALGLQDAFVLTVQPDGKLGWVRHVGSAGSDELLATTVAVSYTHLDVYKRQVLVEVTDGSGERVAEGSVTLSLRRM